jgi:hypothetical protein
MDHAVTRELAFQEGVRHAQLTAGSSYSFLLSIAATAAVASASAMYVMMRRNAH